MKNCIIISLSILFILFFAKKLFFSRTFDLKKIWTAKGEVNIEEINKNIFEINGYFLKKNALIPILKKKLPMICSHVFNEWKKVAANGLTVNPPKEIPNPTLFLLNNYTVLKNWYWNQTPKNTNETLQNWNRTHIDTLVHMAKIDPFNVPHSYEKDALSIYAATKYFKVKGQVGAVIGSQTPWAEVYLLANDAEHVTTIDFYHLSIEHPKMDFFYAPDLPSAKEKYYDKFDFIVSFSSIEHSGLGRYGDPIDPIGDIREMNKIHCMLKPKGLLYLGFPVGVDTVVFNAHRIYGRIRLAMMFEGFTLLKIYQQQNTINMEQLHEILSDKASQGQILFVMEKMT